MKQNITSNKNLLRHQKRKKTINTVGIIYSKKIQQLQSLYKQINSLVEVSSGVGKWGSFNNWGWVGQWSRIGQRGCFHNRCWISKSWGGLNNWGGIRQRGRVSQRSWVGDGGGLHEGGRVGDRCSFVDWGGGVSNGGSGNL